MSERGGAGLTSFHLFRSGATTPRAVGTRVLMVAASWILLYLLNGLLFEALMVSSQVSWIFLPAALRMLSVLLFGWAGALGIFVGSLITGLYGSAGTDWAVSLQLAGLSALSPLVALLLAGRILHLRVNLSGLKSMQLLGLSVIAAGCAALLHNVGFVWLDLAVSVKSGLVPMFVGDLLGTLVVLYLARLVIGSLLSNRGRPT